MAKKDIKDLSTEELGAKERGLKTVIVIFVVLILLLFFFQVRTYWLEKTVDMSMVTIVICSLAGPVMLIPQLKEVRQELQNREK